MSFILIIVIIIAAFAVLVATQPSEFRVERSANINAPPSAVFAVVNDMHKWNDWSPWTKLDPNSKTAYEGPGTGVGSVLKWDGNNKVGQGVMTITESRPSDLVRMRLDFIKPFAATNGVDFTFKTEGAQTKVTWAMYGKNTFMSKAMGLVMNCNKMLGGFFDQGLSNLKALVERGG